MGQSIIEIFKIDKLRSTNLARILFLVLVLLNLTTVFFPLGDNDFDKIFDWYDKLLDLTKDGDTDAVEQLLKDVPITRGNWIYIAHVSVVEAIVMLGSMWYTGLYIRDHRLDAGMTDKALSGRALGIRVAILFIGSIVLFLPLFMISALLFFAVIFVIPYLVMFRACYLSGDYSFFGSVKGMFGVTRGFYLTNVKNLLILVAAVLICDLFIEAVGQISTTAEYVLDSYLSVLLSLATARYIGIIYCIMTEHPGSVRVGDNEG